MLLEGVLCCGAITIVVPLSLLPLQQQHLQQPTHKRIMRTAPPPPMPALTPSLCVSHQISASKNKGKRV